MHTIRKLSTNAWVSLPGINLVIGILGILTSSLVARSLGPLDRGVLAASMLWSGLLLSIGALVNGQSATYSWAKSKNKNETLGAGITLSLALSAGLVPVAFLVNYTLAAQSNISVVAANIYSFIIPTTMVLACLSCIFLAEGAFGRYGLTRLAASVVYTAGVVLLSLGSLTSVINIAILNVLATLAAISLSLYWLLQERRLQWGWAWDQVKLIATYGTKVNMAALPSQLNLRLDQAAMALWLPSEVLGYYTVAVAWSTTQSFVGTGVSAVLLSRASNVHDTDSSSLKRVVDQFRVTTILLLMLGAVVTLVTPLGIRLLFGVEFIPAIAPAVILCVAGAAANIKLVLHEVARGLGHPSIGVWAESLGLLVTGVLLVLLLPTMGMVGAAWASLASYSTASIVLILMTSRRTNIPVKDFVLVKRTDLKRLNGVWPQARN